MGRAENTTCIELSGPLSNLRLCACITKLTLQASKCATLDGFCSHTTPPLCFSGCDAAYPKHGSKFTINGHWHSLYGCLPLSLVVQLIAWRWDETEVVVVECFSP
jgi:hypothetical protein